MAWMMIVWQKCVVVLKSHSPFRYSIKRPLSCTSILLRCAALRSARLALRKGIVLSEAFIHVSIESKHIHRSSQITWIGHSKTLTHTFFAPFVYKTEDAIRIFYWILWYFFVRSFGSYDIYELVCSLRCANRHTIHFVYGINMPQSSCLWFSLSFGQTYVNNASLHCFQFMDVNKTAEFIIIFNEIHTMGR